MERRPVISSIYQTTLVGLLVLSGLCLISLRVIDPVIHPSEYLLFHTLVEMFSIAVAWSVFMITWNARQFIDNDYLLLLGISSLFVGGIDLVHTLAFQGMGIIPGTGDDANIPTQLWIAARYVQSLSLLAAPLFIRRKLKARTAFIGYALAGSLLLLSIFYWKIFPVCYVEGAGLTKFKIVSEYIICLILLAAMGLLLRNRKTFDGVVWRLLVAFIVATIGAELAFTSYISVNGPINMMGHFFKVVAFYLLYTAIIETGLMRPYNLLFRNLKQSEEALRSALEESRQRPAENSALLTGSRAVLERHEFSDAALAVFNSCKSLVGATGGYVALLNKDGTENQVLFLDSGGRSCSVDPTLRMPIRGLREQAYRTGQAVYHNSFAGSEWIQFIPAGHVALDNVLFAPLVINGRSLGLLGLANKPGGFTENDARMAAAFGELAAIALFNSQTLEALESGEERFRSVAQTATDAIISVDNHGNIILWNNAAETTFGYSANEAVGKPLAFIMPERFREAHTNGIDRLVTTGVATILGKTVEVAGLRKDGREFPLELSLARWTTKEGLFFTGIARDITQRKQAEEAVRRAHDELETRVQERTAELLTTNVALQAEVAERQKTAQTLQLERAKLKSILDAMQDGVYIVGQQYTMEYVNPLMESEFGALNGHKCYEYIHNRADVCPWCRLQEVLAGQSFQSEWHSIKTNKIYDTFETPVRNADGSLSKLKFLHNITERKQAEEARARLTAILEATPDFVAIADRDGNMLYYNSGARKLLGLSEDQDISQIRIAETYPEWAAAIVMNEGIPTAIRSGMWSGETALLSRDGREVPVSQVILAHKAPYGAVESLSTIARDITERKHAEQVLRQKINELAALYEASQTFLDQASTETILENICRLAVERLGVKMAQIGRAVEGDDIRPMAAYAVEQDSAHLLHFDPGGNSFINSAASQGGASGQIGADTILAERLEIEEGCRSFATLPLHRGDEVLGALNVYSVEPEYFTAERLQVLQSFVNLATVALEKARLYEQVQQHAAELEQRVAERTAELVEANAQLERLNEQKNQFLGMAAHDLRSPLSVIHGFSQLLIGGTLGALDPQQLQPLSYVQSASDFMLRLVNDLLDIASIEAGELRLNLKPTDLIALVERIVALNRILAAKKQITIHLDYGQAVPEILADASRVEQVLNNLISNALKFSYPRSTVQIRALKVNGYVVISVRDEGQGIPADELGKLFKPFTKMSVKSTDGEKSTGLGLAIARKIVVGHKGNIWAESEVGKGSIFYVSLPIRQEEQLAEQPMQPPTN